MTRIQLYTEFDKPLNAVEREPFKASLKRRSQGEPVAYITGTKEFMGFSFAVGPEVLIPRPDTEVLVESALNAVKRLEKPRILDVGTGSGCIALSLALKCPAAEVVAWDIDDAALNLARANATALGAIVSFACCDALAEDSWTALHPAAQTSHYDLIVSNPPYISPDERPSLSTSVINFEPSKALFAAPDGLLFYRALARLAPKLLKPNGLLMVEIGSSQAEAVANILTAAGWSNCVCSKDWERRDRVIQAEWCHE
jgi:release factor glutamine methyltransferase